MNKVAVAEKIGCGNELKSSRKMGSKNEMSFNKKQKIMFQGGWVGGYLMNGWVGVKAVSRIAYSNQQVSINLNQNCNK